MQIVSEGDNLHSGDTFHEMSNPISGMNNIISQCTLMKFLPSMLTIRYLNVWCLQKSYVFKVTSLDKRELRVLLLNMIK